ncbi:LlaJI family restriction endonuclease [Clostridium estertheticum]|uniref:LlaJI family restriction endonuclease n=1 Tax=Clostridium estertheticum TaxID=238834 RepID=UPI001C0BA76D|nr:LlaJI family restriction endonuclease [Clostridium estertheticum]MBU3075605.1 LlaJI family restriction endonuclease [Clostridium estertheticum]MBU3164813.1 LlaJI family restriction endonuclease [Clostridium estertheticum]
MEIRSKYIREQRRYSRKDLMDIFHLNQEETVVFIIKLKAYGVLKMVKATFKEKDLTDLIDEEIEIVDVEIETEGYYYVFTFVGVLTVGNIIIKCFPKYLLHKEAPLDEMKQVLKVLNHYNSKEQIINLFNGDNEQSAFNLLAVILYILNDYYENGLYTNQEDVIETNGDGEILWDNTINDTFAIICNNRPFYTELQTTNTVDDEMNYFKRLHQCILTECSKKLEDADLLELFEMDSVVISEEELSDFGDVDYVLYRLYRELNVQFSTRKQRVLKTIYAYILHSKDSEDNYGISMYGTNSFNLVWENVCAEVFNNQLSTTIGKMKLPMELHKDYQERKKDTLLEIIDKPIWRYFQSDGSGHDNPAKKTLKPDLISLYEKEAGMCFGIFDAKYYNIILEKGKVKGQPGVGDVTKQYLYQLAFNPFILKNRFACVQNAFLMPTEEEDALLNGEAEIEMLKGLSNPPLINILVVKIPAKQMYQYYLSGNKLDIHKEYLFL